MSLPSLALLDEVEDATPTPAAYSPATAPGIHLTTAVLVPLSAALLFAS